MVFDVIAPLLFVPCESASVVCLSLESQHVGMTRSALEKGSSTFAICFCYHGTSLAILALGCFSSMNKTSHHGMGSSTSELLI